MTTPSGSRFEWRTPETSAPQTSVPRETRLRGSQWLARYSPLLDEPDGLNAQECRQRLELVPGLREDGAALLAELEHSHEVPDAELRRTLEEALGELDNLEAGLRHRIGFLVPGDPAGALDVAEFRDRLAEAAARHEIEGVSRSRFPEQLELRTAPANWACALFMGVFSFGWLSFTTMHAAFMMYGMSQVFGWAALGLLGFYAIFFMVGFGMAWGAIRSASREEIALEGRELTVRRHYPFVKREKKYRLAPNAQAYIAHSAVQQKGSNNRDVVLLTDEGDEIRLASGRPEFEQSQLTSRLNEYLRTVRT